MPKLLKKVHISYSQQGFTLVELIVVVAIVAILTAVLFPKLLVYTENARVSKAMGDLSSMKSIVKAFAADHDYGYYPTADTGKATSVGTVLQDKGIQWYDGTKGEVKDPWGNPYYYGTVPDSRGMANQLYLIISFGPDGKEGTDDDIWISSGGSPTQSKTPNVVPTSKVASAP
ncbi:MAG: type II secretion system protein GspG [Thermoanaerobacteraceae bacterium]|nr:type II secretion system protein GspG [Thermoanaerobacteraceae bacterium]